MPATPRPPLVSDAIALVLGYAWLGLLWAFGALWLTRLAPWMVGLAIVLLAVLPAYGLWVQGMARKRLQRTQFAPQGRLGRWLSGRVFVSLKAMGAGLALSVLALFQVWLLAPWEWGWLCLVPLVYWLTVRVLARRLAGEFAHPWFAWRWTHMGARWWTVLCVGGLWLLIMAQSPTLEGAARSIQPTMSAEQLDATIARIQAVPSGVVRWLMDATLVLNVTGAAAVDVPQALALRFILLAVLGPLGLTFSVASAMQGACACSTASTRPRAMRLERGDVADQAMSPGVQRGLAAFVAVIVLGIAIQGFASLDGHLRAQASPLALQRLPQCERIGQKLYRIGTADAARAQALAVLGQLQGAQTLCAAMQGAREQGHQAIERYLDWYFSLGAELGRIGSLLTGQLEGYLQKQLEQKLQSAPALEQFTQSVRALGERNAALLASGEQRVNDVLAQHHLAIDPHRCLVQLDVPRLPALDLLGNARERMGVSAAGGVAAGAFAAAVAAKAMGKVSMKTAAKVATKMAAKQGAGKLGAGAAGAAAGAVAGSVVPGVGTAVGAFAGAATSMGIEWAALRAEEALTRDAMRDDLRAALDAQLDEVGQHLSCGTGGSGR